MTALELRHAANTIKNIMRRMADDTSVPEFESLRLRAISHDIDSFVKEAERVEGGFAFKETRSLHRDDVRRLSVDRNWYTRGTNEDFERLLSFVSDCDTITTTDVVAIARDIKEHSDTHLPVFAICCEIANICRSHFE